MNKPLKGFITYSHEDTVAKDKLRRWLAVMEQQNKLMTWHDAEMIGGDTWSEDIFKHLADSDILLYLVSAASLQSKNCNKELAEALRSEIRVIPIILESCDWLNHQLSDFQALPDKGKPIDKWQPESKGWQNVVDGIREAVEEMQAQSDSSPETSERELRAELAFQHGNVFMMIGQVNLAIDRYSHAIELNPNNAFTYNNRGTAYYHKCEYAKAITDYTKTTELMPDYVEAYNNSGLAFYKKAEYVRAIHSFTKAIELKPDFDQYYNHRGVAYNGKCDFDSAVEDFNKSLQLNPNSADAYNNRGNAYQGKDIHDRAIEDYTAAIELRPAYADAYYNRGMTYAEKGDSDDAISDFTKAITLNPKFAEAYYHRGVAYGEKGNSDRAIENFTRAIELKSDYPEAYTNLGVAFAKKGDFDRAIEDFNKAIILKPHNANLYSMRGTVYAAKGEYAFATADFNKAIALNPNDAGAYSGRGFTHYRNGDFDCAIADYNHAIQLNPDIAEVYCNRGEAWLRLGEWEKAKSDLMIAKKKGSDIIASFRNDYKNVEAYERANRVKLPEDIAAMLTQPRRSRYPKTEKLSSFEGTPLESSDVLNLLTKLRNAGTPLSDYIQTRPSFGIKTGSSGAFVVDSATRDRLIAEHSSSVELIKPFLHGRDIRRWRVAKPDTWLIFTYRRIEIDHYPAIRNHLEKYRSALSKRSGKQKWYELPAANTDADRFTQTKLICPDNYDHQTFAVDSEGFYCGDTCYLIPTEETWLCGLLNSRVVEWFYSQVSKQLTGDYLRARSRYMQQIPIPDLTSVQKGMVAKIVDYLIYLEGQPTTIGGDLANARDFIMLGYYERIIDGLVYESFLREALHQGAKHFFKPLLDEGLPNFEDISGDKMLALREIFERLYEKTHPVRSNLFFLDSVKQIRIIEDKA